MSIIVSKGANMAELYNLENDKIKSFIACGRKNIEMIEALVMEYTPLLLGKRFLSDAQLSQRLSISRRTLQDYRDKGILPYYRLDGKILYDENDIERFISSIYVPKY